MTCSNGRELRRKSGSLGVSSQSAMRSWMCNCTETLLLRVNEKRFPCRRRRLHPCFHKPPISWLTLSLQGTWTEFYSFILVDGITRRTYKLLPHIKSQPVAVSQLREKGKACIGTISGIHVSWLTRCTLLCFRPGYSRSKYRPV